MIVVRDDKNVEGAVLIHHASSALALRPWDLEPRFDVGFQNTWTADGWTWRTLSPGHPALLENPRVLRRNDPGDALGVISEKYGEPKSYCVLGGNIASVSNWEGISYQDQYAAVTQGAGAFPCGGMYYLSVVGPNAADVLNLLTPKGIELLEVGQATFVIFTTPEGTVDTEGIVLRDGEESFKVSIGGDTRPPTWLHDAIDRYPDTQAEEADLSSFNIKGPKRLQAMARLVSDEFASRLDQLPRFRGLRVSTRWGGSAWVVRTVIGIEMWADPEVIHVAWRKMVDDPDCYTPCGWDVLATYRLECPDFPFYLCPLDIHRGTYLFDVDLGHVVSPGKQSPFVGQAAIKNTAQYGGRMWIAGLMATIPEAPRRHIGERFLSNVADAPNGYVTSAGYSPKMDREVCFAHLPADVGPGSTVRFEDGTSWRVLRLPMLPMPAEDR
jgi:aminomethyltransferase